MKVNNEKVKVYTESLNEEGIGDFVKCVNCGQLMLVKIGEKICKNCKSENLQWADGEYQECNIDVLKQHGYIIEKI